MDRAAQLHHALVKRRNLEELRTLCFDLDVDYDNLGGEGKEAKSRELVQYLVRHGRLAELERVATDLDLLPAGSEAPYLGLHTFTESEQHLFFGREALVSALRQQTHRALLAVVGASGSGKSSVVRAGLIPALRQEPHWCIAHPIRPGPFPLRALAAEVVRLKQEPEAGGVTAMRALLARHPDALLDELALILAQQQKQRLLLVVDQFEELWTVADEEERSAFLLVLLSALAAAPAEPPFLLLLTLRADFLHRTLDTRPLADAIQGNLFLVPPLSRDELRWAISGPLRDTRYYFEADLDETLLDQATGRVRFLPLLAVALRTLWERREPDGKMTGEALRLMGGVGGALAARADEVLRRDYGEERAEAHLRPLLVQLVQPGEGVAADARRRLRFAALAPAGMAADEVQAFLQPLVNAHLLTTDQDEMGQPTVELAHEVLLRDWAQLREWVERHRHDLRVLHDLEAATSAWASSGQQDDYLLRGLPLANALAWQQQGSLPLSKSVSDFLREGTRADEARVRQAAAAQERELQLVRRTRRLGWALALYLALVVAVMGYNQASSQWYPLWQAKRAGGLLWVREGTLAFEPGEASNGRWRLCVQAGRCTPPPPTVATSYYDGQEGAPIVGVDALQARAFCQWQGRDLPTLEEWQQVPLKAGDAVTFEWTRTLATGDEDAPGGEWAPGEPVPQRLIILQHTPIGIRHLGADSTVRENYVGFRCVRHP